MNKRHRSNKKKAEGIFIVERRGNEEDVTSPILMKKWADITSMDLYHLYEFHWKTDEISKRFGATSFQILNRLRR